MSAKRTLLNKQIVNVRRGPKHMARKIFPVSRVERMKGKAPPYLQRLQRGLALLMDAQTKVGNL